MLMFKNQDIPQDTLANTGIWVCIIENKKSGSILSQFNDMVYTYT
jgi:hypothetical protein